MADCQRVPSLNDGGHAASPLGNQSQLLETMETEELIEVEPAGNWGRYTTYLAKVGTLSSCLVLVKRVRKFHVKQRIEFVEEHSLRGCSKGIAPRWRQGYIWKIEDNRLFISL